MVRKEKCDARNEVRGRSGRQWIWAIMGMKGEKKCEEDGEQNCRARQEGIVMFEKTLFRIAFIEALKLSPR